MIFVPRYLIWKIHYHFFQRNNHSKTLILNNSYCFTVIQLLDTAEHTCHDTPGPVSIMYFMPYGICRAFFGFCTSSGFQCKDWIDFFITSFLTGRLRLFSNFRILGFSLRFLCVFSHGLCFCFLFDSFCFWFRRFFTGHNFIFLTVRFSYKNRIGFSVHYINRHSLHRFRFGICYNGILNDFVFINFLFCHKLYILLLF